MLVWKIGYCRSEFPNSNALPPFKQYITFTRTQLIHFFTRTYLVWTKWRRWGPLQASRRDRHRGSGGPHTYRILKFVVGSFGLDFVLLAEGSVWDPCCDGAASNGGGGGGGERYRGGVPKKLYTPLCVCVCVCVCGWITRNTYQKLATAVLKYAYSLLGNDFTFAFELLRLSRF
jgi:hypothetical protein